MRRFGFLMMLLLSLLPAVPALAQDTASGDIMFETRVIRHDGRNRFYLLYVPPQLDHRQPVPLVFVLHGGGGNPALYEQVAHFGEKARDEGFILVYPGGTGRTNRALTWNAGHCCSYALEHNIDDVGFFRKMVAGLQAEFNIDPARIYVAGHSNGAMMSYRLASEMSDVFAAAGVVAGAIGGYPTPDSSELFTILPPQHPVSILHIHGMADINVRYEGGINGDDTLSRRNDLAVADAMAFWAAADQCEAVPDHAALDSGMVLVDTYDCATTGTAVKLISIVDGGHSWPGGDPPLRRSDPASPRVNATDELWAFFSAHPRADAQGTP